jgi:lipoate-protein ligase A
VVVHENDLTFALIAPRKEAWARLRPDESYRVLHLTLADALEETGIDTKLFDRGTMAGAECFAGPVRHDVMAGTRKIAGGAQRRTKRGLLHQGSIQTDGLGADFAGILAARLAKKNTMWSPPADIEGTISSLVREKYAQEHFLRREVL